MSKEQEIMKYLHDNVFDPVLVSETASPTLKKGIRLTVVRMGRLGAAGMIHYFWSAVSGTEKSVPFYKRMLDEGFTSFEDKIVEFRERFSDL